MSLALGGPTLLDLQIITDTDLEEAAAFFTGFHIGFIAGSFLCGAVFSKVNSNLFLFMTTLGLGGVNIAVPYCDSYVAMIASWAGLGLFSGIIATAVNARIMRIWGNEGVAQTQFIYFNEALGGTISPLYAEPFLAARPNETEQIQALNGSLTDSENLAPHAETTDVGYAFFITAVCILISSVPFFISFLKDLAHKKRGKRTDVENITQRQLPMPLLLFMLVMLCLIVVVYCSVEGTFSAFLLTFLVNEYDFMTKSQAAYMTAIFYASFAVSRFLMIFISKLLTAVGLMYLSGAFMLIAFAGFIVSASLGAVDALSVFSAVAGLSMSAVFGACLSWTESELLRVTGRVSSSILIACSLGNIISPLALGYLMEEVDNMWFCYLLLGATVLLCFLFVFLLYFNRCFVNKHYGPISVHKERSLTVDSPENQQPLKGSESDEI